MDALTGGRMKFTAWVIFTGADHRRPWRIFTRRGFRHVMAVLPAQGPGHGLFAPRYSVLVNAGLEALGVDLILLAPERMAEIAYQEGATLIIKVPIDRKPTGRYVPRGPLNCVSVVKAALGIRAWSVWTPEQLARWLIRNGGQIVERGEAHDKHVQAENAETGRGDASRAA